MRLLMTTTGMRVPGTCISKVFLMMRKTLAACLFATVKTGKAFHEMEISCDEAVIRGCLPDSTDARQLPVNIHGRAVFINVAAAASSMACLAAALLRCLDHLCQHITSNSSILQSRV
mmetsp:Transcript_12213/g.23716  ORF Transcript_12213/g.23716 Transcript_12213/m.23716 type:complete len:117 (+) Transcript_12213:1338-1688(+)